MRYLFMLLLFSCGKQDNYEVVYQNATIPYTFAELSGTCGKCHPGSAPGISLDEAGFRGSAKVKAEIESGDMPPASYKGSFDKAKALAFFTTKGETK